MKLAPDLDPAALDALVTALLDTPAAGVILSNTSTARAGLRSPSALGAEAGGLSGAPLLQATLGSLERARRIAGARLVIVASGGIGSAEATRAALDAGAGTWSSCGPASSTAGRDSGRGRRASA